MIDQRAFDCKYLHRDFHNLFNLGLCYLHENYGKQAVCEYLTGFANRYFFPLSKAISQNGLSALAKYIKDIYAAEEALEELEFSEHTNCLTIKIRKCPAISHMKKSNIRVYPDYVLTSSLVYQTIAENAGYQYKLIDYDKDSGYAVHQFYK